VLLAAAAAAAIAATLGLAPAGGASSADIPPAVAGADPLAFDPEATADYERAAAFGLSHVLYAHSPGGVIASARRTARFRALVDEAVDGSGVDADIVEAMVMLESAGRAEVIAGDDPASAAGLGQILAGTATTLLGMPVDLEASRRLTRAIALAQQRRHSAKVERLRARRRQVDARFDPAQALAGTVRYLTIARERFGADDLAVVSYHMGIGNLEGVLRAYAERPTAPIREVVGDDDLSWARIYFDSSPARHSTAWLRLINFSDDSQTYYWRVLAAREVMRLFREDRSRLEELARLHGRGESADAVLHPPGKTERFTTPDDIARATADGRLVSITSVTQETEALYRISPRLGALAGELGRDPTLYRALRPEALDLLRYLTDRVHELSRATAGLIVTAATYDMEYKRLLDRRGPDRISERWTHTTGYAFNILRRYESGLQRASFQYMLERLRALGLIAWTRGNSLIHIAVSPAARCVGRSC
jgi:hypothetical protein